MTLPSGTGAFYFYAEPNAFATFTVQAVAQDGTTSGPVSVNGASGATYLGFYGTGGAQVHTVILTGFAGLVAGAVSMGLGEFTSVQTQNDQVAHEVAKERAELVRNPEVEAEELAGMWIARGLPAPLARQVAHELSKNPDEALRVHAQEELGVNPHEQPSPWIAAISSFLCFSAGALVPLLPYLFGGRSLWLALAVGGVGLFGAGAVTARFTGRTWYRSGLRQLVLGIAAAGVTYVIGKGIGISGIG